MFKLKYVFFDCWDTVIQLKEKFPHSAIKAIYDHVINKENTSYDEMIKEDEDFLKYYFDNATFDVNQEALIAYMCELHNLKLDISYKEASYLSSMAFEAPLIPGVKKFLAFLKENNIGCSILSNSIQAPEHTVELVARNFEKIPFDYILSSSYYAVRKPDPRFYNLLANKVGVDLANVAFIGDSISSDITGANAANVGFCGYFNWKNKPGNKKYHYYEFKSYDELETELKKYL